MMRVRGYPLFPPIMLIDAGLLLLQGFLLWLILAFGEAEAIGMVIGVSVLVLFMLGTLIQAGVRVWSRYKVLRNVEMVYGYIAWRFDGTTKEIDKFINSYPVEDIENTLYDKLANSTLKKVPPIDSPVFITVKPMGSVKFNWNGVDYRVRGLQKGSWIEIEWINARTTFSLALHELAHHVIEKKIPGASDATHHALMAKCGLL